MVRRGQQKERAVRHARRAATDSLESQQGSYVLPDRDDCALKQWEMPYDEAYSIRVQYLIWRQAGRMADFVVNIQVLTSDGWVTVEYFDCCHGHCHHHHRDETVRATVLRLDDEDDVSRAFQQVEGLLEDRVRIIRNQGRR